MRAVAGLLIALASVSLALTQAYSVEPVKASWSGWTRTIPGQDTVSQIVTCCWDSLSEPCHVELFVGFIGTGSNFDLDIRDEETDDRVAYKHGVTPQRDHYWLRFDTLVIEDAFVKGRKYRFEFTRSQGSPDSIHYYFAEDPNSPSATGPYLYGQMIVGGTGQPTRDLCMRCYGLMDPIDSTFWGMDADFPWKYSGGARPNWVAKAESAGVGMMRVDQRWYESEESCGVYDWAKLDSQLKWIHGIGHHDIMLLVCGVPKWASTRFQWYDSSYDTSIHRKPFLEH